MTSRAAGELQQQIRSEEEKGNDVIASQLIAKQTKARMLALLCHSSGQLTVADVGCMALLMAQIKHGDIYLAGNAAAAAELALLRVRCHNVMCKRLPDLMPLLQQHPELLTNTVSGILGLVPDDLQWQQVSSVVDGLPATASYQAISRDGHVYSLNLLDGTVLLDGNPPGRLPREIVEHPLYVRTFGRVNFHVAKQRKETAQPGQFGYELRTLKAAHGRYYHFYLAPARSASSGSVQQQAELLVITEVDRSLPGSSTMELELLDVGEECTCKPWGDQLPVSLRELYSHWLCRCALPHQLPSLNGLQQLPAGTEVVFISVCLCLV
jgi:hypothetical protein